jgi:integrase/recombinase XerD
MAGKQAKVLSASDVRRLIRRAGKGRYPDRNRAMVLLSVKAGLRACEIARLTWPMVTDTAGRLSDRIELQDRAAKKGAGRTIPLNPAVAAVLRRLIRRAHGPFVIESERGSGLRASSVVNWFRTLYAAVGLRGCSSHSGRRTFITRAARLVHRVGGSIRDVQQLAGHSSLSHTQRYIDGATVAKRRLVGLI